MALRPITSDPLATIEFANVSVPSYAPDPTILQNPYTLALGNVPAIQTRLRVGGIYWLVTDRTADADSLARQLLNAMQATQRAALITAARSPGELVQRLDPHAGPGELHLFSLHMSQPKSALAGLQVDLERAIRPSRRLLILMTASIHWQDFDSAALRVWLLRWLTWLETRQCTLLILSHGDAGIRLMAQLLPHNPYLSGLVRVHRSTGQLHFVRQYWRNSLGVSGAGELILNEDEAGFQWHQTAPVAPQQSNDEDLYIAQKEALEGAPVLSTRWVLVDNANELFARAVQTQAASIIFCIDHSEQFVQLARMIHRLRMQCGLALKIVVREIAPSLRRHDEQALLACGTNLIVPVGTTLSRFLVMLESVQGQVLQRSLATDIEPLLRSTQSLRLRGKVTPEQFVDYLATMAKNAISNDPGGVLLVLDPVAGLNAEQVLTQSQLRRQGDVVCELNRQLYLFLFGCPLNNVETALANIFRLPYQDLFLGYEVFTTVEQILAQAEQLRLIYRKFTSTATWTPTPTVVQAVTPQTNSVRPPASLTPVRKTLISRCVADQ